MLKKTEIHMDLRGNTQVPASFRVCGWGRGEPSHIIQVWGGKCIVYSKDLYFSHQCLSAFR